MADTIDVMVERRSGPTVACAVTHVSFRCCRQRWEGREIPVQYIYIFS